jgi:hypothetical protein
MESQETLLDGLGIVEHRGFAIYEQVLDKLTNAQNNTISAVLRELVCDLDLDTKELVFASYVVGKMSEMRDEDMQNILMLRELKNLAKDIVDNAENNSENN